MFPVLVTAFMKKLKIISPYSLAIIFIFFFSLLYTFFYINHKPVSKYSLKDNTVAGYVYDCQNSEDKTVLKIKGKENLLINYYDHFECKLGQKIKAIGEMKEPKNNTNFYLFNYKKYLLSEKINYTFTAHNIEVINNHQPILYKIKNILNEHIKNYKSKAYLNALVLGNDNDINEDIEESYQTNGISHLLAISGAQITLFSTALLYVFNKIFSKNTSYVITITFLLIYLFITNFSASVLRATLFFIILTINKQFELKINTLSLLILTASLLLIINPYYIYSLGFTLSFTVSFYLLLFKDIISKYKNYFSKTLVISLIAFFASTPIIINSFFKLNLLSPLINIYFVPLMTFIIYPIALITFIFKPLDLIFLNLVTIMENASIKLSSINFLNLSLCHLGIFFFIIYYVVITLILYKWLKGKNYILILFLILMFHHNINYLNPASSLTMLDVGQGDSFLIKLKHNKGNILIDTGGIASYDDKKPYDIAENITIPYLQAEGIDHLDYLIITHGDFDHIGMAINLINNFKVENVIFNIGQYNDLEQNLINLLKQKNIPYYQNINKINLENSKLEFLNYKEYDNENDNSNIIYIVINNTKLLFMGDAGAEVEEDLLKEYNLKDIDILKVGHHGSKTSSSKKFINSINPKYSIISVGENNSYGHPNKEVLDNLANSIIYRTDLDGSVKFTFTKKLQIKIAVERS